MDSSSVIVWYSIFEEILREFQNIITLFHFIWNSTGETRLELT